MNATQQITLFDGTDQEAKMQSYYRFHAKIYDLTRWIFLFGRKHLLDSLPYKPTDSPTIMEVGCGTGCNIEKLSHHFPKAQLIGVDVSAAMLDIADKKRRNMPNSIVLAQKNYGVETFDFFQKPDCILFSYCLTMVNPNWENLVLQAKIDLNKNGIVAIVDFHTSRYAWFRRWMRVNHVRMEGHLLPFLERHFETVKLERRRAYFGLWHYMVYIGMVKQ